MKYRPHIRVLSDVRRRLGGFTLIELLVVVSIIALLLAILLPAINKGRAKARSGACKANERAIATSLFLYVSDYGRGMLTVSNMASATISGVKVTTVNVWNTGNPSPTPVYPGAGWLTPYFGSNRVQHCPGVTDTLYNASSVFDINTSPNYGPALYGGTGNRPDQVPNASGSVMLGDIGALAANPWRVGNILLSSGGVAGVTNAAINRPSASTSYIGPLANGRHNGICNVVWMDGHVSEEVPWMSRAWLSHWGAPAAAASMDMQSHMGFLMPSISTTGAYTDFSNFAAKDLYFAGQ